jgi:hypothetical protein
MITRSDLANGLPEKMLVEGVALEVANILAGSAITQPCSTVTPVTLASVCLRDGLTQSPVRRHKPWRSLRPELTAPHKDR